MSRKSSGYLRKTGHSTAISYPGSFIRRIFTISEKDFYLPENFTMTATRMEAFSDGVLAIIITIMVLELRAPQGGVTLQALRPLIPVFLSYVLSFVYVGIYWNNHHHLLHAVKHVNGRVLWCNLHLLFWLSLIPFVTSWVGEHYNEVYPIALYGFVLMMAGIAYYFLVISLIRVEGLDSDIAKSIGNDFKGKISVVFYIIGIALSFINTWIGIACYVMVACIWFIPDKRIEKNLAEKEIQR
jgi:uncharacterized membrane protein